MNNHVGMVAGEPSGDLLAARILQGLLSAKPDLYCAGIGGPQMQAQGFDVWHPMAALSVFGYVDALKSLPKLVSTYRDVRKRWLHQQPRVFVGIDAPDFNLRLEAQLRKAGIPTVHFVGPSIWAWRYERITQIRQAVSHMLVLFPFEEQIYQKEGIPVTCVGHPLARVIPMQPDALSVRQRLGIDPEVRVLALLPGSRASEVKALAPRFVAAAHIIQKRDPNLHILVPMVNSERRDEFERILAATPLRNCHILMHGTDQIMPKDHRQNDRPVAWDAMEASDAVLVASGTATLEAALFKRPMVISYVLSPVMRRIMAWKSGQTEPLVPWVGLPNILAQDFIVPELLQEQATPEALAEATWKALTDTQHRHELESRYVELHQSLRRDTAALATEVILAQMA